MILLRRTSIARQVLKTFLVAWPYGFAAINTESAVTPIHHILNDDVIDFSFGFKHFNNFIANQLFKRTGIRRWADPEGGIIVEAAIGGQHMQMGIKIMKISKTLDGDSGTRKRNRKPTQRERLEGSKIQEGLPGS